MNSTTEAMLALFKNFGEVGIRSTGAKVIFYEGVLYNVDGSSNDPDLGKSWKNLLIENGIDGNCYVTNETPDDNSHPKFKVGGHMTPNSDGKVATGADSYLMPLCSWHNHTERNGVPFTHNKTKMLLLSGFMEGDNSVSFMARLPSAEEHTVIFQDNDEWKAANLMSGTVRSAEFENSLEKAIGCKLNKFILLERAIKDTEERYFVREMQF